MHKLETARGQVSIEVFDSVFIPFHYFQIFTQYLPNFCFIFAQHLLHICPTFAYIFNIFLPRYLGHGVIATKLRRHWEEFVPLQQEIRLTQCVTACRFAGCQDIVTFYRTQVSLGSGLWVFAFSFCWSGFVSSSL